ncbi:uncharacterized protein Z519_08445 [Cladophialophora bantiana CBS 173.52]|uniref:Uncharacterized protein n=1 Tax=Cladophialophora bantiana (strain ATCC 10958 / CBS 173.52 / CDC B-1940 / NIH 8579) TaxID=1442370 RepID=A0A0D2FVU4_CLAB1|nr:uncharacterized protein Z519_08445 [Cladophialophora bantiana CBS 173.52]KIW90662.1 hypothetical protein Z519_08445 [Cladophialophora bantiana CBS 173.52]
MTRAILRQEKGLNKCKSRMSSNCRRRVRASLYQYPVSLHATMLFLVSLNICLILLAAVSVAQEVNYTCPDPAVYFAEYHGPFSAGRFNLSYQRPPEHCRTFNSSDAEDTISHVRGQISDPDLSRLFENAFPNTLDAAIR